MSEQAEFPSHEAHRRRGEGPLSCFVITVSDSRDERTDRSGPLLIELLEAAGHRIAGRKRVPDEPAAIEAAILAACDHDGTDAVLLTGGTGIAPRDRTAEVLTGLCDRILPGFGELFRALSYAEIGAAAMLSRAVAGLRGGRLIVALPGSPTAVRLAMDKLLLPEMGHIVSEAQRRDA